MLVLPVAILGLVTAAAIKSFRKPKPIPESVRAQRKVIYEIALNSCKEPEKLRMMANAFRNEGLDVEAEMLDKRAALQELPEETKKARKLVFRSAMKSTDITAIEQLAFAFESEGSVGAAENLREYAQSLKAEGMKNEHS